MPSAANVKIDKQVSPENALTESTSSNNSNSNATINNSSNSAPLKQVITLVEHKIRNLEKRKAKLETYRDLQNAGKELNADQKNAVAKYNEVLQTLEFARDIYKQFLGISVLHEKEAKKQAKKEAALKNQSELARLREILLVQDALNQMGNETVREDFLHGRNGAAQLTEADLKLLDDLYPAVTPKHEAGNPTAFTNEVQAAAEHLLAVVDGKPKEVFGGTYSQVKEILGKIHESGYFDQVPQTFESYEEGLEAEILETVQVEPPLNHPTIPPSQDSSQAIPPIENLTIEPIPIQMIKQNQLEAPVVEQQQAFFQQPPPPQPPQSQQPTPQPPRPITEMLGGTGSFFFLQDSEIDTPPEQIPSQTFTNQNYVNTGTVPPTVPPTQITALPLFQNIPTNLPPPPPPQQQQPPPTQQQPTVVPPPVAITPPQIPPMNPNANIGKNGLDELQPQQQSLQRKPQSDEVTHKPQGPAGGNRHVPNNQSYYQNNNSYNNNNNNRPRQNRNPPRSTNRHN